MSPSEKLRVLFIRDCLSSAALTAYFFLPQDYGIIAVLASIIIMRVAGKKLKGTCASDSDGEFGCYCAACVFTLRLREHLRKKRNGLTMRLRQPLPVKKLSFHE